LPTPGVVGTYYSETMTYDSTESEFTPKLAGSGGGAGGIAFGSDALAPQEPCCNGRRRR